MTILFQELTTQQGIGICLNIKQTLCRHQSRYQEIVILETEKFGRMMVLDGCIMLTERDEFVYHEMLAHPAACCHPQLRKALVVGGGDGGTVRELLRHPDIQHIDLVELDEDVVKLSKTYLPKLSADLSNPKVSMHFTDGVKFIADAPNQYDLILIDSTDPVGPAAGLITDNFYKHCQSSLTENGILALQSGSPFLNSQEFQKINRNLQAVFNNHHFYTAPVITYPSGYWSFAWAAKHSDPLEHFLPQRLKSLTSPLKYYNAEIHKAAFALPNFVKQLLQDN